MGNSQSQTPPTDWRRKPRRRQRYTQAMRDRAVELVRQGHTTREVARMTGMYCNSSTISKWCRKAEIEGRQEMNPNLLNVNEPEAMEN